MRAPNLGAGAGQQNQIKKALGGKWNSFYQKYV